MLVTGAVLLSAVLHAAWNALAHRSADATTAVTLISLGLAALSLPLALVVPPPAAASWPYLGVSVFFHVAYTLLLGHSYGLGDFGQTYPMARGTAPLVVALLAVVLAGEHLTLPVLAGLAGVSGGLAVLVGVRRVHNPRAVLAAGLTGLCIAGYTTVDGLGVRQADSTLGYTAWLLGTFGLAMLGFAVLRHRGGLGAVLRRLWWIAAVGGTIGWASYALVLWAQTRGALAAVAALRETSVVVAAVIGTVFFGESFGRRRIAASALVAAGAILLTLG